MTDIISDSISYDDVLPFYYSASPCGSDANSASAYNDPDEDQLTAGDTTLVDASSTTIDDYVKLALEDVNVSDSLDTIQEDEPEYAADPPSCETSNDDHPDPDTLASSPPPRTLAHVVSRLKARRMSLQGSIDHSPPTPYTSTSSSPYTAPRKLLLCSSSSSSPSSSSDTIHSDNISLGTSSYMSISSEASKRLPRTSSNSISNGGTNASTSLSRRLSHLNHVANSMGVLQNRRLGTTLPEALRPYSFRSSIYYTPPGSTASNSLESVHSANSTPTPTVSTSITSSSHSDTVTLSAPPLIPIDSGSVPVPPDCFDTNADDKDDKYHSMLMITLEARRAATNWRKMARYWEARARRAEGHCQSRLGFRLGLGKGPGGGQGHGKTLSTDTNRDFVTPSASDISDVADPLDALRVQAVKELMLARAAGDGYEYAMSPEVQALGLARLENSRSGSKKLKEEGQDPASSAAHPEEGTASVAGIGSAGICIRDTTVKLEDKREDSSSMVTELPSHASKTKSSVAVLASASSASSARTQAASMVSVASPPRAKETQTAAARTRAGSAPRALPCSTGHGRSRRGSKASGTKTNPAVVTSNGAGDAEGRQRTHSVSKSRPVPVVSAITRSCATSRAVASKTSRTLTASTTFITSAGDLTSGPGHSSTSTSTAAAPGSKIARRQSTQPAPKARVPTHLTSTKMRSNTTSNTLPPPPVRMKMNANAKAAGLGSSR